MMRAGRIKRAREMGKDRKAESFMVLMGLILGSKVGMVGVAACTKNWRSRGCEQFSMGHQVPFVPCTRSYRAGREETNSILPWLRQARSHLRGQIGKLVWLCGCTKSCREAEGATKQKKQLAWPCRSAR